MSFFSRFRQASPVGSDEKQERTVPKWSMGVLNDKRTIEVPGETPPLYHSLYRSPS